MPALFFLLVVVGGYCAFSEGSDELRAYCKEGAFILAGVLIVRAIVKGIIERDLIARHRMRIDRLQAFTNELARGSLDARGFYSGGPSTVCGTVEGKEFQLTVRLGRDPYIAYELRVKESAVDLDAVRPPLLDRLLGAPVKVTWLRGGRRVALEAPIERLLVERGFARVNLTNGWLRTEARLVDDDLRLDRLLDVCRMLGLIARLSEPRPRYSDAPEGETWTSSSKGRQRS